MEIKKRNTNASIALIAGLLVSTPAFTNSNFPYDPPPEGLPGECFARVLVPAQFENYTEQTVIDEGSNRVSVTAPQFQSASQQYVVRDAGMRYEVRQPVYRRVSEQVMVRPGYQTLQVVPGEYRTVTEQVEVSPPRLSWKPSTSLASMAGVRITQTRQGEVYCLVEEPGEVQNVSRRMQVRAESVRAIDVPPIYKTISRDVLVDPGGVREIPVPAQYGMLNVQHLVQPARQHSTPIAPQMGSINRKRQISGESFRWIKVLCETNATASAITEVQTMLHNQGYYQGPVSGVVNTSTESAIASYQQQMSIPHGGFLSLQTIESLRGGLPPAALTPPAAKIAQSSHSSWSQTAPPRYSYPSGAGMQTGGGYWANNTGSTSWQHRSGQTEVWSQSGHLGDDGSYYGDDSGQIYRDGEVLSRIPSGEVATDIIGEVGDGNPVMANTGTLRANKDQTLGWHGK